MKWFFALLVAASPAAADPVVLLEGAGTVFSDKPRVVTFEAGETPCGMRGMANPFIGYCASERVMYIRDDFADRPTAAYEMAHVMGHYYQITYGVADVALREISRRRDEEPALRGMVTRQVECLAGVVMNAAGLGSAQYVADLPEEPFTDSHWGRAPLSAAPRVSIGQQARAEWFAIGYRAGDVAACSVGEMSADLLVAAQR